MTAETRKANTELVRQMLRDLFAPGAELGLLQQQEEQVLPAVREIRTELAEVKRLLRLLLQGQRKMAIRLDEGVETIIETMEGADGFLIQDGADDGETYG